jgi:hypothetical protein
MANILDPMDIKQIFSLYRDGLSNRKIASVLGISGRISAEREWFCLNLKIWNALYALI